MKQPVHFLRGLTQVTDVKSIKRVIEGVTKGQAHKAYEVAVPEQFVILKIKIEEIVQIRPSGTLERERI